MSSFVIGDDFMAHHFLDSSALLKRYRDEIGTSRVVELSQNSQRLVVARLAHVEVTSAIVRRGRVPGNSPELIASALAALEREMGEIFEVIEIEGSVIPTAIDLAGTRHLRAADAIQLACALLARPGPPELTDYFLVSADEELNAAARAEGLRVENPISRQ